MSRSTEQEVKLTLLKVIELSYKSDKGLTTSIFKSSGAFKIAVNQNGQATIAASAGNVTVSLSDTVNLGVKFKALSVSGNINSNGDLSYKGQVTAGVFSASVSGKFNIVEFLDTCQTRLCYYSSRSRNLDRAMEHHLKQAGAW
ncbi:hypothetical protein [Thaumasiovibrio subtropicus]|uniref:hypothetical protein n=1 Tax=Thaumasiovibrio subtropicus TaxID=1891207 RepID=UPI000B34BB03|nr:hypothetical protein [Thaumasiovibrio subtropicus]